YPEGHVAPAGCVTNDAAVRRNRLCRRCACRTPRGLPRFSRERLADLCERCREKLGCTLPGRRRLRGSTPPVRATLNWIGKNGQPKTPSVPGVCGIHRHSERTPPRAVTALCWSHRGGTRYHQASLPQTGDASGPP